jgi:hypothetical protein
VLDGETGAAENEANDVRGLYPPERERRTNMKPARRLDVMAAVALFALTVAGCVSLGVHSFADRQSDFTKYHTYAWAPRESFSTGDPRLDNNPFFQERLRSDVENRLAARGFERVAEGAAQLLIQYHTNVAQQLDLTDIDREYADCGTCGAYVYDRGTIVLDFADPRSNRLVWRGWAEGSLDGIIDSQKLIEQKIDQAVERIMNRFPGRL